jgi:SHS2 domain-containing protein
MPYRYLEDIATADTAFEATGRSREELVIAAADALLNVMVENLDSIEPRRTVDIGLESDTFEMILFHLLDDLVYYKDAERLLLRIREVKLRAKDGSLCVIATACGEEIDAGKHHLIVDVKAITMHRYTVEETREGWKAIVVVDV